MKKLILTMTILTLLAVPALALDVFPDLELTGSLTAEQAAHLGVETAPLKVSDIKGDYLLVEVFSLYCPICQRDAPEVNALRRALAASDVGSAIRFIGIGAGNTPFEINFYAKKYEADFPLFHDEDFVAHKALENVGTPAFYLVDLKAGLKLIFFHEGEMDDHKVMLDSLLKAVRENGRE
ncbi:TlpA disulfide reductase family protein [Pseudodesulfovibrio portus]|nr:TlpA disulfide reductase family protein [Pseudodesulfovibrio portus]